MAMIAIQGSVCSGHGNFPPRADIEGEPLLRINGVPVMVDGCAFAEHSDGTERHGGKAVTTRPWLTVNGKGVVCVDDPVSCGSTVATGDALVQVS